MDLIFIYGPAASGKLTIGQELSSLTGIRLFHNHLIVDALLAAFDFGSEHFIRLRERMWLDVFEAAAQDNVSLIFTFTPEKSVNPHFISRTVRAVQKYDGNVKFVQLVCPLDELERRVELPSRAAFRKVNSIEMFRNLRDEGSAAFPEIVYTGLVLETSTLSAQESARRIADHYRLVQ